MKDEQKQCHKTSIGGQALIEGVMMRGPSKTSMAVRLPSGEIDVEEWETKKLGKVSKIPIIRGIVSLVSSLAVGYKCLSKSAEKAGLDEESENPSKFEKWLDDKFGDKLANIVTIVGSVLGVILAIGLFMFLPSLIVKGIDMILPLYGFKALIEGVIKIIIFILYLLLVAQMKEIKRVYQYHGAEHKSIFCYEYGLPLTVENVRKQQRFHPRCGTSFTIIVLILSILLFSVVTWDSLFVRMVLKIALLPILVGVSYELIKLAGKYDNWFTKIISFPGLKLQHLTTREPDDSQIEAAIAALNAVLPKENEDDKW